MDMIFCLRQTQGKCIEQNLLLYAVFIVFTKTFDMVSRDGLWQVFTKFVNIVESLHNGRPTSTLHQ